MIFTKKNVLCIFSSLLFLQAAAASSNDGDEHLMMFKKVSEKLQSLKTVSYHYTREFSYPAEHYHAKSEGEMYIEFDKTFDLAGFQYQYVYDSGLAIFNNSELFNTNNKDKTINISNKIKVEKLEGQSPIYNSLITLRNILPTVINSQDIRKSVGDTLINNQPYYVLTFETQNKFPNYVGNGFSKTTIDLYFFQKIIVDQKTLLPITVLQTKKGSQDLNRTDFSNLQLNPKAPNANSWYYSNYLGDYQIKKNTFLTLIKAGTEAPDFTLTNHETKADESLSKYKGELVLLEFWIKNCGYCIAAAPKLNTLQNSEKNLKILAINTEDSETMVDAFVKSHQVKYTVLRGHDTGINKNYGVDSFPQVVLLDKTSTVIYSGDLDIAKLQELVKKHR